ncbi:F0F1 ATP synthase subunit B' [Microcoleus sp. bin38.metabat.b11b12b14.051]|uniref:F0F1 ATP synthase subunit B' n=1 Tax=Microcoleus sp. bin38.metabat.b11b12b14.051 TaxID=2742709 RepID=UPI0025CE13FF|nr:F0F1 ATP synthase subunit B' [Microcoleus sp. bin38.metabat.b11b12b14.051]
MMHWTVLLAVEEAAKEGGLFDLDATLPLMAVQFLILVAVLNVIFYKPLSKSIDDRADYIRNTQIAAQERLAKAQQLAQQYEQKLGETRKQSQSVIVAAQAEAQKIGSAKVAEAQQEAQAAREKAGQEIEQQKQEAMRSLEQQVDALSSQILQKLLGPSLVK